MIATGKRRPRHLEKTLFVNHKEELLLQERLEELNLKSRIRIMQLEKERITLRNEFNMKRKQNRSLTSAQYWPMTAEETDEAIDDISDLPRQFQRRLSCFPASTRMPSITALSSQRNMSAPAVSISRKTSVTTAPEDGPETKEGKKIERKISFVFDNDKREVDGTTLSRQISLVDENANNIKNLKTREPNGQGCGLNSREFVESHGAYLLDEYRRMSRVVPSILLSLSPKDDKPELLEDTEPSKIYTLPIQDDSEPDLSRVSNLVRSVKRIRHQIAINKRSENTRPKTSLQQMFKDLLKEETFDEHTDGACVLIKRMMDRKRRQSVSYQNEYQNMQNRRMINEVQTSGSRRQSMSGLTSGIASRRTSVASSVQALPDLARRGYTSVGLRRSSVFRRGVDKNLTSLSFGENITNSERLAREMENYELLQEKVNTFLAPKPVPAFE
ncbi:hypothetical protein CHS0354_020308 [Potamilus streckersoni]|uniref:Uncharacterized protein n=1 Tax=Potamilus streckersoni TaxID=2493646 RepID=A0AAE0S5S2_9BIVA|nr:hypothetical protein CHS0354_020308 [Potamilus streckersoni]